MSPVATASSQRFHRTGATSYAGSPVSGFGSIANQGSRSAASTLAKCRSVWISPRSVCGSLAKSAASEMAWSTNRRGTRRVRAGRPTARPSAWRARTAGRAGAGSARAAWGRARRSPRRPPSIGSWCRSWPGSARSSSITCRRGSARSRRTAPSPAQARSARCSYVASGCGQPSFSTARSPVSVRTGSTRAVSPVIADPSTTRPHSEQTSSTSRAARPATVPRTRRVIGGRKEAGRPTITRPR